MKNTILVLLAIIFSLVSCNKKVTEKGTLDTHMMDNGSEMMNGNTKMNTHACSMHPEIEGIKGDMCSKCGMELTEKSKKDMENKIYACPMHPEVQGKFNDKCSKCGMPLTVPVTEKAVK